MTKRSLRKRLAVEAGEWGFSLESRDTANTLGVSRKRAESEIEASRPELLDLQTRLYAESRRALLVVLQGMDTCGKDGTIKHVIGLFNPVDIRIANFKQPTEVQRRHHFLWRIRKALPAPGQIGIFNRSLRGRAGGTGRWVGAARGDREAIYSEINRFEKELEAAGTTVVKVCLHISWEEQRRRLLQRLERPDKV